MLFSSSLIAVDIGSSAIKMLELSGRADNPKLKNFAIELLPRGAIENGAVVDVPTVSTSLKKLVGRLGVKGRRASVSVAGSGVLLKRVRISPGKDATLEEQVNFHASQAFQLDLADLYYDYAEMGESLRHPNDVEVLLAGARREVVEQVVNIVKSSGLLLGSIEAAPLSIANMFELNYGVVDGVIALISVGANHTQVSFVEQGRFIYNHEMPTGGEAYTSAIMQSMNLSRDSAEALKISAIGNSGGVSNDLRRILSDTTQVIVNDIQQIFSFFASSPESDGAGAVKFAFLTGGASRTLGLDAAIAQATGLQVYFINPYQRITVNERTFKLDQVMSLGPFFGVAIGLGMRAKGDKVAI
jgi:type IV pilus assembly protein PilM